MTEAAADAGQIVPWVITILTGAGALGREAFLHRLKRRDKEEDDDDARADRSEERGWARVAALERTVKGLRVELERRVLREASIVALYARRESQLMTAFELALLAPQLPEHERHATLVRSRAMVADALRTVLAPDHVEEADEQAA